MATTKILQGIQVASDQQFLSRPVEQQFFTIDVAPKVATPQVVREGFQVPAVALNKAKSSFFVDNLELIEPKAQPRVVTQSIAPGTKVSPGTAIDVTLAPPSIIPFDIFDQPHRGFLDPQINVGTVTDNVLNDPKIRQTLLQFDNPNDVPAAEKQMIVTKLAAINVHVDEANADTNFASAFTTVRSALAFR